MNYRSLLYISAVAAAVLICSARADAAAIIDFDGLPYGLLPAGYGDSSFSWKNFASIATPVASGYRNGVVDGNGVGFNYFARPATLSSTSSFTLNSAYFTGAWNDGLQVTVLGFEDGSPAPTYTKSFTVDTTGPKWISFNWRDVTSLQFTSEGGVHNSAYPYFGEQFAFDRLSINSGVPEPGAWAIMLTGLFLTGGALRYRRRKASPMSGSCPGSSARAC